MNATFNVEIQKDEEYSEAMLKLVTGVDESDWTVISDDESVIDAKDSEGCDCRIVVESFMTQTHGVKWRVTGIKDSFDLRLERELSVDSSHG